MEYIESLLLVEDDEKWYLQAGFCMVESVVNLFNDENSDEEHGRIGRMLGLLEAKVRQDLISGFYQNPAN